MFVPQSRPRLFVIAVRDDVLLPDRVLSKNASKIWHTAALRRAVEQLPAEERANWLWWNMPVPAPREEGFGDLIEERPESVKWHSKSETTALLSMMSEINLAKVETAKHAKKRMVGTIYKRTRWEHGIKVQRAEIRFDDVAGCLRTPAGGSSRQLIMVVEGETIRSRLISARETARLMGLSESYKLPEKYNQAYHLTGDGVAVPVVRFLAENIFNPIVEENNYVKKQTRFSDALREK
jgi:DNA (cytosine-5)-methyltransferase 1